MKRLLAVIALAMIPLVAYAHSGGREVKGTIVKASKTSLRVKSTTGKIETFPITTQTRFSKGKARAIASDMRIGSRAIVHLSKDGKVLEVQLPSEKIGTLEGRIVSRDLKKNELKVAHGDVKGIMKAMTMSFYVHNAKVSELPRNGTRITAKLHAGGGEYWLTDVKRVQ